MYWLILCLYTNLEVRGAVGGALSIHSPVWGRGPNGVLQVLGGIGLKARQQLKLVVKTAMSKEWLRMSWRMDLDTATQLVLHRLPEVGRKSMVFHSKLVVHWNSNQLMLWKYELPHAWSKHSQIIIYQRLKNKIKFFIFNLTLWKAI